MRRALLLSAVAWAACGAPGSSVDADAGPDAEVAGPIRPGGVAAPVRLWGVANVDGTALRDLAGGAGAVAAQPVVENRTRLALWNFNPAVAFDGEVLEVVDGLFPRTQPATLTPAIEVFAAVRDRARVGERTWIFHEGTGADDRFALAKDRDSAGAVVFELGARCRATAVASTTQEPSFLIAGACAAADGTRAALTINGVASSSAATFEGYTGSGRAFQIGGCQDAVDCPGRWSGDVGELYVVTRALAPAERARVATTLAIRWGVTLAQDLVDSRERTLWADDARWRHDVAAIARDQAAGLDQRQANPSGTVMTVAAGAAAATNADNPTALPDGAALVWGHDGGGLNWIGGPPGARYRVARLWRFASTDAPGQVTLRWFANESSEPERVPAVGAADVPTLALWISASPDLSAPIATPIERDGEAWIARATFPPGLSYAAIIAR